MAKKISNFNYRLATSVGLSKAQEKYVEKYWHFNNHLKFKHTVLDVISKGDMSESDILKSSSMVLYFVCLKCDNEYNLIALTREQLVEMVSNNERLCYNCLLNLVKSSKKVSTNLINKPSEKYSKIKIETTNISFNNTSNINIDFSDIISYKIVK